MLAKAQLKSYRRLFLWPPILNSFWDDTFPRKYGISLNLTFDDLWWPQYWPYRKIERNTFVIISYDLSNTFYGFSLRRLGAELERRGLNNPFPPSGGGKSRGPSGRGPKQCFCCFFADIQLVDSLLTLSCPTLYVCMYIPTASGRKKWLHYGWVWAKFCPMYHSEDHRHRSNL